MKWRAADFIQVAPPGEGAGGRCAHRAAYPGTPWIGVSGFDASRRLRRCRDASKPLFAGEERGVFRVYVFLAL